MASIKPGDMKIKLSLREDPPPSHVESLSEEPVPSPCFDVEGVAPNASLRLLYWLLVVHCLPGMSLMVPPRLE